MKSEVNEDRYYLECACGCPTQLIISFFEDDKEADIYMHYTYKIPLFKRLFIAIKYIFKRDELLLWDSIVLNDRNVHQLEDIVNKIKSIKD